jgi:DNA-directed RNA polymerase I, II, and III subunit RPABC2
MSKNGDDDVDYFSGDDNESISEDSKEPDVFDYEEEEEEHDIKKISKKPLYNDEEGEEEEIFEEENDDNYDDYDDDEQEEEEDMNSSIRHGGGNRGGANAEDLESSLQNNNEGGEQEDDEDGMNENYLQKFDSEINKDYIVDFHPECFVHNYEEINTLTQIVRDVNYNIIDPLHKTIPFLTKYEKARIIGIRAKQINSGAKPFIKVPENIIDGYLIAEMELKEKRVPFIIKRPIPGGTCEYWKIKDLEIIGF